MAVGMTAESKVTIASDIIREHLILLTSNILTLLP